MYQSTLQVPGLEDGVVSKSKDLRVPRIFKPLVPGHQEEQGEKRTVYTAIVLTYEGPAAMLIGKGADVNAKGGYYGDPLQAARERGH